MQVQGEFGNPAIAKIAEQTPQLVAGVLQALAASRPPEEPLELNSVSQSRLCCCFLLVAGLGGPSRREDGPGRMCAYIVAV